MAEAETEADEVKDRTEFCRATGRLATGTSDGDTLACDSDSDADDAAEVAKVLVDDGAANVDDDVGK